MSSQQLYAACESGRVADVTRLLTAGGEVNYVNKSTSGCYTPLIIAAANGHSPVVRLLLQHGAEANTGNKYGKTALHLACYKGEADCVRVLLEHGADFDKQHDDGGTPLHEACRWFKPGVVQQLLEAGARTDTSNNQGQLPVDLVPEDEKEAKEIHKMLDKAINMITAGTVYSTATQRRKSAKSGSQSLSKKKLLGRSRKMTKAELSDLNQILTDKVSAMNSEITNSITELEKQIKELKGKINTKDGMLEKMQKLIESLKREVQARSAELSQGINNVIQKSNDYYMNNCQENHLSEIVFLKIFESVCEKIRYKQDSWQQLARLLFENFPDRFVTKLLAEINCDYNTKKDCCLEMLFQWKLYSYSNSDGEKLEELQAALSKVLSNEDATELERNVYNLLTQHQQKSQQQMEGSLTDKGLGVLAGQIGKEWHNLGLFLELSPLELDKLEKDFPAAEKRNLQMLLLWRNRETGFADMKLGRLAEALGRCGRADLAKALK